MATILDREIRFATPRAVSLRRIGLRGLLAAFVLAWVASPVAAEHPKPTQPARCLGNVTEISDTYDDFREQVVEWVATCVSSGRAKRLVAAQEDDLKSIHQSNVGPPREPEICLKPIYTWFELAEDPWWGVESIEFVYTLDTNPDDCQKKD